MNETDLEFGIDSFNQFAEENNSLYSSHTCTDEYDSLETFLNFKTNTRSPQSYDNCTKVVEIFIYRDGKIIAQCTMCSFKTDVMRINSLLEHFIKNHSITYELEEDLEEGNTLHIEKSIRIECVAENEQLTNGSSDKILYCNQELKDDNVTAKNVLEKSNQFMAINGEFENKLSDASDDEIDDVNEVLFFENSKEEKFEFSVDPPIDLNNVEISINVPEHLPIQYTLSIDEENSTNEHISILSKENISPSVDINSDKSVSNSTSLDEKFYIYLNRQDSEYCTFCGTNFHNIARHHKNRHPELIMCDIAKCNYILNSLPELNEHQLRFHSDPKFSFSCTLCDFKTYKLNYFRSHYQRMHLNTKHFQCNFCEMKFFSNYEKLKHIRTHTGVKPFVCETCQQSFPTRQRLNLHVQKYHSEPQFACDVCNKRFFRKLSLKEHQITKHGSNEKQIECNICGSKFYLKKQLREHFNNWHNPNRKRWMCTHCDKTFSKNSHLKDHLKIHERKAQS